MKKAWWKYLIYVLMTLSLIIYLCALYYYTIGKTPAGNPIRGTNIAERLQFSSNFVPFRTIAMYVRAIKDGSYLKHAAVLNLAGNVILVLPLAVYFPFYVRPLRKFWKDTLAVLAVVLIIELTQLITGRGSLDIDDVILNMIGAMLGYAIWSLRPIQWILNH